MACASCLRKLRLSTKLPWPRPILLQIRGKKTRSAREPNFVNVRLRGDITKYGRKGRITSHINCASGLPILIAIYLRSRIGAIVPIAPGRMRNDWFPRGKAEYVNDATLRQMKSQNIVFQRDFGFKIGQEDLRKTDAGDVAADIPHESLKVEVELLTVSMQRTRAYFKLRKRLFDRYTDNLIANKVQTTHKHANSSEH